ncbi:MAG: AI-2E family transporter [Clostridia bacterium]|nr:AI-2E family transporter [Clostridia bacterium]
MKFRNIKGIGYFPLIILTIVAYKLLNNISYVKDIFDTGIRTLTPFIWGFVFAYLLNPVVNYTYKKFRLNRGLCMAIAYLLLFILFLLAAMFIGPAISESIADIALKAPGYAEQIEQLYIDLSVKYPVIEQYMNSDNNAISENVNKILAIVSDLISNLLVGVLNFTSSLFRVVIGLIISVYFLKDKDKFQRGIRKITYSLFRVDIAKKICDASNETNEMFSKYFVGKIIDSVIIGVICFFGMLLIKAPYPVLLAVIIGVTNMIPFFGPFIGAVPAILLALLANPMTAVYVAIFVLLLQQFDGYILGPKILGDSVGLSAFWIILAILVGGALMGVIGMLIAVPITALIRNTLVRLMNHNLNKKNLKKFI